MREIEAKELDMLKIHVKNARRNNFLLSENDYDVVLRLIEQHQLCNLEWNDVSDEPKSSKFLLVVDNDYEIHGATYTAGQFYDFNNEQLGNIRYWVYEENVPLPKE